MADLKIITNVGYFTGNNGIATIYVGKTPSGAYFAAIREMVSSVDTWKYVRRSVFDVMIGASGSSVATDFNKALLIDTEVPDFVTGTSGYYPPLNAVINGSTLPRLFSQQLPYTLNGDGILASDISAIKTASGNSETPTGGTGTGTSTGLKLIPDSAGFQLLFSNPIQFVQTYAVFVGIVALAIWYFGTKGGKKKFKLFGR